MAYSTPPTFTTGQVLTAATLNTYLTANLNAAFPGGTSYTSYTPTLTAATTNPTLGSGSSATGRYLQIGDMVHVQAEITFGTSGANAGSGVYRLELPVDASDAVAANVSVGSGWIRDDSTSGRYVVHVGRFTASTTTIYYASDSGGGSVVSATAPFTWDNNDTMRFVLMYQVA